MYRAKDREDRGQYLNIKTIRRFVRELLPVLESVLVGVPFSVECQAGLQLMSQATLVLQTKLDSLLQACGCTIY